MPGRLTEFSDIQVEELKKYIKGHASYLLLYSYIDYLRPYGTIQNLAKYVGLPIFALLKDGNPFTQAYIVPSYSIGERINNVRELY